MAKIIQQGQYWRISGEVVFNNVSRLLETSLTFNNTRPTVIDFAQVTNVDTSAISLMLEWQRRAFAVRSTVNFVNLTPNLISLASLYGVADFIPQDVAANTVTASI